MCLTDLRECCRSTNGLFLGNWIYPDGSIVPNTSSGNSLYTTRGPSALFFHRNINIIEMITGIFTCQVPDVNNYNTTLYVFLYSGSQPGNSYKK